MKTLSLGVMRFLPRFLLAVLMGALWLADGAASCDAHPMGNFSINHYARFEAKADGLKLRYILDFAEIPTAERLAQLDANGDEKFSAREKSAFLESEVASSLSGLSVQIDGRKAEMRSQSSQLDIRPGAGGLQTLRVVMDWKIVAAPAGENPTKPQRVVYTDSNFPGRSGWMEVIALDGPTQKIVDSDAASADRSRELIVFPVSGDTVAPRQREAAFSIATVTGGKRGTAVSSSSTASDAAPTANSQTPQNRFTQSIAERQLTPALVLWGMLAALAFGAIHALSPGHGKTMVAAYLVGSRGTPRHAILLGLVVTITHTLGVFALGLALLFASRYILPERLFPALSALSGLLIFGVGLWLFMSRWQGLSMGHSHHDHSHSHDGHSHGEHSHDGHSHNHGEHTHEDGGHSHHDVEHEHSHGTHTHSHGGRSHSHSVPDGPITMKTLVALGISGGIVPCPEALVVLLAAVKLHRIGYGMLLITAFSIGLAAALIAIGMLVVSARQRLSRFDKLGEGSALVRYLPLGSAAVITLIGAALTLRAAVGTP